LRGAVIAGRGDRFVLVLVGDPLIVGVVRVVVRDAAEIHRRIIRRQNRDEEAEWRTDNHETRATAGVPDATTVVVTAPYGDTVTGEVANDVTTTRVIVVMAETCVDVIPTRARVLETATRARATRRVSACSAGRERKRDSSGT
jgi:hypothetical protein